MPQERFLHDMAIHVIGFKKASGTFSFHFWEVYKKKYRIYRKILNSDEGDFEILVKTGIL